MKISTPLVLVLGGLTSSAFSALSAVSEVSYTTDVATSLMGSFSLDIIADNGVGATIANFPHFHFDLLDLDGYPSGGSEFFVALDTSGAGSLIVLEGQDLSSTAVSATRSYDASSQPSNYPDFSGTYLSPFDGQTIGYSYTNVQFSGNIVTGDFAFNIVPEPSSACLGLLGLLFVSRRRR